jgi:polyribonucleotide nucleotidyltransferase
MEKKFRLEENGIEVVLGKFANQADGAAWVQQGGTVVFAAVVSAPPKEFPGFLPLTVDYREIFAAAGKIPGGYFKREGKFTDKEILTGRLIDRAIRPLFPENFFNQVQILSTVYSVDKEHMPHGLALLAASIALSTSTIPFLGPVGVAEVARVDGKWIVNPTYGQTLVSDVKLIVAGTEEGICMVEGSSHEITESEFVDVLFMAFDALKKQVMWQKQIAQECQVKKEEIVDQFDWNFWTKQAHSFLTPSVVEPYFNNDKLVRGKILAELQEAFLAANAEEVEKSGISETFLKYVFDDVWQEKITDLCFVRGQRFDLRDFDTVRPIVIEVGLLPRNHGSSLFTRGRTQALASVTLGGGSEQFKFEGLMDEVGDTNFMLHYNFPPFAVGEVRPQRAPGRREVGHGHLAQSALKQVLPDKEKFPYLMRIVADILESDGSSSMATICSGTMALMDAGVPISKMVSGVAMGLLRSKENSFHVLTDISGSEDTFGLMDFKVAGTDEGIVAIQMDIKHKGGLKREVFEMALAQARKGRIHILAEMRKVLNSPRPQLSELVPRVVSFKVPKDKIGAIIGTGGKTIREIIERTTTTIDIEDDGLVKIFGQPGPKLDQAVNWVKLLGGQVEKGSRYEGKIRRIADFGLIVEIVPGLDGLVHISTIPRAVQEKTLHEARLDDVVNVEIVDYDPETGRIRLKLV